MQSNTLFEQAGLTPKEASIYQVMLKFGEVPIANILKETQDHPQIVYRAIDGLISRGLALVTLKKHKKYVRAESPKKLEEILEAKYNEARQTIPMLLSMQKVSNDAIIRVYKGYEEVRAARKWLIESLPEGGTYYVIGASGTKYFEIMGSMQKEAEKLRVSKKIWKKMIMNESQREPYARSNLFTEYTENRYLQSDAPAPSSVGISGKWTHIFILTEEPIAITIESEEVAQSFIQQFEALWVVGKP